MMRSLACAALAAAALLGTGCRAGSGHGWVGGSIHIEECRGAEALERGGDFDLEADYFAADPLHDATEAASVRRNSLTVRIQHTSNRTEESDAMVLHIHDTAAAARAFAAREAVAVDACLERAGCPSGELVLRAQLNLYNTCPANRSPLAASNRGLQAGAGAEQACLLPQPAAPEVVPGCPALSEADRAELEVLCGDFDDRTAAPAIERLLGRDNVYEAGQVAGNACLYFCKLGKARRGQAADELGGFELDFGDQVAAVFSFNMVDVRAFQLGLCATARAQLRGLFSFEVVRSRTAQAFP